MLRLYFWWSIFSLPRFGFGVLNYITNNEVNMLKCRVRSDLRGKEQPPLLNANRKDVGKYLECLDWMDCLETESFENEDGIILDEHGYESSYTVRFRLPSGEIVWGMNIDLDVEDRSEKKKKKSTATI